MLTEQVFGSSKPTSPRVHNLSSANFSNYRVIIEGKCSDWYVQLEDRLRELVALPVGWDGYYGQPVSFHNADFAATILERLCRSDVPTPDLIPGTDGSLQIEWHVNDIDVELDILSPQHVIATIFYETTGLERTEELDNDYTLVANWLDSLSVETADNLQAAI